MRTFSVRKAIPSDLHSIKEIADREKKALGFITRGTIIEAIKQEQIVVVENSQRIV